MKDYLDTGILQDPKSFTVQVRKEDGKTIVGTAFVISKNDGLLVTCKHVVRDSRLDKSVENNTQVWIYCNQLPDGENKLRKAHVKGYLKDYDDDIVLLQIENPPFSSQIKDAILGKASDYDEHDFRSFGYRQIDPIIGIPAYGKILGSSDKPEGTRLYGCPLALSSQNINSGMSGSPVLDKELNLVVGVIASTYDSAGDLKDRDLAFAVPCDVIKIFPFDIQIREQPYPKTPLPELKKTMYESNPHRKFVPSWNHAPEQSKIWVERNDLLRTLSTDYANPNCNLVVLVGFGGEGKTSLVRHWLDDLLQNNADETPDGIFWWSFDERRDVDQFFESALLYTTDNLLSPALFPSTEQKLNALDGSLWRRYIFILDGMEVFQSQDADNYGHISNFNLRDFLTHFAAKGSNSLCIITTRVPVIDLNHYTAYFEHDVKRLTLEEGRELLRKIGVKGPDPILEKVVTEWNGHALTLSLLGALVMDKYDGNITNIHEIITPKLDEDNYQHVGHILEQYDSQMTIADSMFLKLFSAFRKPVGINALASILHNQTNSDCLTLPIDLLNDVFVNALIKKLTSYRILYVNQNSNYSIHPLVRAFYYSKLQESGKANSVHRRIKDYYLSNSVKIFSPPTLDSLVPLIEAVYHSCRAGDYDKGYGIYLENIDQKKGILVYQLGAYETALGLMHEFFPNRDSSKDPMLHDPSAKIYLLRSLGLCMMTVGRLKEALSLYLRCRNVANRIEDWFNAGKANQLLTELHIHLGELDASKNFAKQAIDNYENSIEKWGESCSLGKELWGVQNIAMGTPQLIICCMAYYAWALHLTGNREESDLRFQQAEKLLRDNNREIHYLRDLWGIYHADYLIKTGRSDYARRITEENMRYSKLNNLTEVISQCHRIFGDLDTEKGLNTSAKENYDEALEISRSITHRAVLIESLLGRGHWAVLQGDFNSAQADLEEALSYATGNGYKIYEADIHMALALMYRGKGDVTSARVEAQHVQRLGNEINYYLVKEDVKKFIETLDK